AGHVWLADQGFSGGQTAARPHDLPIANTADPEIYRTEHFGMRSFSWKLPNGRYIVKLFFAETYDQAAGPGKRVFSFDVNGAGFMGFDVYALARGRDRAVTQTVYVDVTNGELTITFTPQVQQPEINGIEIVSQR
ncbi:MAG: protein kinase, partial [Verrucomicrobia bacterium]|nr:protein kinase [Verrucomicrobiota bacterium]